MSTTTAGISPAGASMCSAGTGQPVAVRTVSIISSTDTDRPDPMIARPSYLVSSASSTPFTTSSMRHEVAPLQAVAVHADTQVPVSAARIIRGTKLSLCDMPGP